MVVLLRTTDLATSIELLATAVVVQMTQILCLCHSETLGTTDLDVLLGIADLVVPVELIVVDTQMTQDPFPCHSEKDAVNQQVDLMLDVVCLPVLSEPGFAAVEASEWAGMEVK